MQTSSQFEPTMNHLLALQPPAGSEHSLPSVPIPSPLLPHIAGFASLNYRLSPHPSHLTSPSSPDDKSRNAKHPNHINDVTAALGYLQAEYKFGHRYILVGHSCGASLAFQVAMGLSTLPHASAVKQPIGIIGVCGLYDIPATIQNHPDQYMYKDFVSQAFGEDELTWIEASPASGHYADTWGCGKFSMIAHSRDDELVEWAQCEIMTEALKKQSDDGSGVLTQDMLVELIGKHAEVWQDGKQIAECIESALQELLRT